MKFGEYPSPSGKINVVWTVSDEDATVTFQQQDLSLEAMYELVGTMRTFADQYLLRAVQREVRGE